MRFANSVNGLVVRSLRLDVFDNDSEMLVMERLAPSTFEPTSTRAACFGSMFLKANSSNTTQLDLRTATYSGPPICRGMRLTIFF